MGPQKISPKICEKVLEKITAIELFGGYTFKKNRFDLKNSDVSASFFLLWTCVGYYDTRLDLLLRNPAHDLLNCRTYNLHLKYLNIIFITNCKTRFVLQLTFYGFINVNL